jgi:hypothetical protein
MKNTLETRLGIFFALALIAALADDPTAHRVSLDAATWGVDVSRHLLTRLLPAIRARMADSPLALLRKSFLEAIRATGEAGVSERDMRRSALFAGVSRRDRDDVIAWALEGAYLEWAVRVHQGGGRPARVLRIMANTSHSEEG